MFEKLKKGQIIFVRNDVAGWWSTKKDL